LFIKQVTVFVENKSGKLSDIIDILDVNKIDIKALSIADTKDYGLLRMIVDKPKKAFDVLKEKGYIVKNHDVIAISVDDRPGGLTNVLHLLKDHNIEIMYMYAFVSSIKDSKASVMLRIEDIDQAVEILNNNGIELISKNDIQLEE